MSVFLKKKIKRKKERKKIIELKKKRLKNLKKV